MRCGLGQENGNGEQETNSETFWIWNEQRLWPYWGMVMKEGPGMKFLVYFELVKEILQCSEVWNIKDGMAFWESKFYFKPLCVMSLWDIQEGVLSRHLKMRV